MKRSRSPSLTRAPGPLVRPRGVPVVDLFCGLGGFSHGAERAGHHVVLAIDWDLDAMRVHRALHPHAAHVVMPLGAKTEEKLVALIRAHVPDDGVYHLHGSPPCTLLSSMARIRCHRDTERDLEEGMRLVRWYIQLVKRLDPPSFSFEQVRHKRIRSYLDEQSVPYAHFDFSEYGVPQTRKRLLGGTRRLIDRMRTDRSLRTDPPLSISDVLTPPPTTAFMRASTGTYNPQHYRPLTAPAWTLVCSSKPSWVTADGRKVRVLSCRELATLQGFGADHHVCPTLCTERRLYNLLGNVVPPPIAERLLRALI